MDPWLALILAVAPVVAVVAAVAVAAADDAGPVEIAVAFAPVVIVIGVYIGMLLPMRYGVTDDTLVVRYGLIRQRIPLADIVEVAPTRNPLSSPALSLDRLLIRYGADGRKKVMISPGDRAGFLDSLSRRARLRHEGARLVRA